MIYQGQVIRGAGGVTKIANKNAKALWPDRGEDAKRQATKTTQSEPIQEQQKSKKYEI